MNWRIKEIELLTWVVFCTFGSPVSGNFCTEYYRCTKTCYIQVKVYTICDDLLNNACAGERRIATTCYDTCSKKGCCNGYTGIKCNFPMCYPLCPIEADCVGPNTCRCPDGQQLTDGGRTCEAAKTTALLYWSIPVIIVTVVAIAVIIIVLFIRDQRR